MYNVKIISLNTQPRGTLCLPGQTRIYQMIQITAGHFFESPTMYLSLCSKLWGLTGTGEAHRGLRVKSFLLLGIFCCWFCVCQNFAARLMTMMTKEVKWLCLHHCFCLNMEWNVSSEPVNQLEYDDKCLSLSSCFYLSVIIRRMRSWHHCFYRLCVSLEWNTLSVGGVGGTEQSIKMHVTNIDWMKCCWVVHAWKLLQLAESTRWQLTSTADCVCVRERVVANSWWEKLIQT